MLACFKIALLRPKGHTNCWGWEEGFFFPPEWKGFPTISHLGKSANPQTETKKRFQTLSNGRRKFSWLRQGLECPRDLENIAGHGKTSQQGLCKFVCKCLCSTWKDWAPNQSKDGKEQSYIPWAQEAVPGLAPSGTVVSRKANLWTRGPGT